jgi:5'(3')-deoxyribonucleotidase
MEGRKFTICCDMDDTIEYLVPAWCEYLSNQYGLRVEASDVTDWDICKFFPHLTKEQIFAPLWLPELWQRVKPREDAQRVLKQIIEDGHDVYICTNTHYAIAKDKFDNCLFKHFPYIDRHKLILTANKQMMRCDILIDDGTHNIIGDYIGILVDNPHNASFDDSQYPNIYRVQTWDEIYDLINSIK